MNKRVLITCVGGDATPALLQDLQKDKQIKLTLIGVDVGFAEQSRPFLEGFHQIIKGDAVDYPEHLLDIAIRENIDIIVPLSDEEAYSLACARERFSSHDIDILVSPSKVLSTIQDKQKAYLLLDELGIRTPIRSKVEEPDQLVQVLNDFDFPEKSVVVKPILGRGGRGMRLLCGSDKPPSWIGSGKREQRHIKLPRNLDDWFEFGPLMVMPLLTEPVYDVDVFAVEGELIHCLVRRRHNPAGIPLTGNDIVIDDEITEYCRKITRAFKLDSLHDIDLMTDQNGIPTLLEVNPRPSGSITIAHSVGCRMLTFAIAHKLGLNYKIEPVNADVQVSFFSMPKVFGEPPF